MENIEIKAKVTNLGSLRQVVTTLNCHYVGLDQQTDTYFCTNSGRMKIRESSLSGTYLILYFREDIEGPKSSKYQLIPINDVSEVKTLLTKMLGIQVVVKKNREIFLYDNIRIHLDEVEDLGTFMELEAVMDKEYNDKNKEEIKVQHLLNTLGIKPEDLLSHSYRELVNA
jgi:predicted adenylyl cyclase CyaB